MGFRVYFHRQATKLGGHKDNMAALLGVEAIKCEAILLLSRHLEYRTGSCPYSRIGYDNFSGSGLVGVRGLV